MSAEVEYDAVDLKVGPVPLPTKTRRKRPVKVLRGDGAVATEEVAPGIWLAKVADTDALVKRETDTESMLPDAYRVYGLEVVTREDAPRGAKTALCVDCGIAFYKTNFAKRCVACCKRRVQCECGGAKKSSSSKCKQCFSRIDAQRERMAGLTPEQRSAIVRKANAARSQGQRSDSARKASAALTTDHRREHMRKINAALTPERRRDAAIMANVTPEQRRERAIKAWATRRAKRAAKESQ